MFLNLFDGDAVAAKLFDHGPQIGNAVVDHERPRGGAEVIGVGWENRPDGAAELVGPVFFTPLKIGVPILGLNAEVLAIPGRQAVRLSGLEENTANASYLFHP